MLPISLLFYFSRHAYCTVLTHTYHPRRIRRAELDSLSPTSSSDDDDDTNSFSSSQHRDHDRDQYRPDTDMDMDLLYDQIQNQSTPPLEAPGTSTADASAYPFRLFSTQPAKDIIIRSPSPPGGVGKKGGFVRPYRGDG
ncbi:MAG: hypothetical protein Q9167_006846, partial [Letrouitia subvulpina]